MKKYEKLRKGLNRVKVQALMTQKACLEIKALERYGYKNYWPEYTEPVNNEEGC